MVTVRDVAILAGVSISTVSRALSAPEKVTEETRRRVHAAAAELGYHPNRAASALRGGRTRVLGLLVPDMSNLYFSTFTKGATEGAWQHDLGVFVVDVEERADLERALLSRLVQQTDGILLCSPRAIPADQDVLGSSPVVVVNSELAGYPSIATDDHAGTLLAVEHLYGLGHRRIAYVGGPAASWTDVRRREALAEARRCWTDLEIIELGPYAPTLDGGHAAAGEVIATGATAAIAFNDALAVGVIRRAHAFDVRIPQDLSVVGFDDTMLAEVVTPTLTSVHTDQRELGRQAVDLLVQVIDADSAAASPEPPAVSPSRLIVRDSTAPEPTRMRQHR